MTTETHYKTLSTRKSIKELADELLLIGGGGGDDDVTKKPTLSSSIHLITPIQSSQILAHETAAVLGAQAFLNILKLPYTIKEMPNAVDISPNGKLPVLRSGDFFVSELSGIVNLAQATGFSLTEGKLTNLQLADLQAYMSLVRNKLGRSLLYFSWLDDDGYNRVTKRRVGSPYAFPMNMFVSWRLRKKVAGQLGLVVGWWWWGRGVDKKKVRQEVYEEVQSCLMALAERLGQKNEFFFGNFPTELDALVFGYLFTMISSSTTNTTIAPNNNKTGEMVRVHSNLVRFCDLMVKRYFQQNNNN